MESRLPTLLMKGVRRYLQIATKIEPHAPITAVGASRVGSVRTMGDSIGSGEGKGGGSGGSIKSAGGALGKKSHVSEEEYFREEQAKKLKELQDTLTKMKAAKMQYHKLQRNRHLDKIKKHEALMAEDKDPSHKIFIDSHKESAEAHQQLLKKMERNYDT